MFEKSLSACVISNIYYYNRKKQTEYILWVGSGFFTVCLFTIQVY